MQDPACDFKNTCGANINCHYRHHCNYCTVISIYLICYTLLNWDFVPFYLDLENTCHCTQVRYPSVLQWLHDNLFTGCNMHRQIACDTPQYGFHELRVGLSHTAECLSPTTFPHQCRVHSQPLGTHVFDVNNYRTISVHLMGFPYGAVAIFYI